MKKPKKPSVKKDIVPRNFFLNEQHEMEPLFGEIFRKHLKCQNWTDFEVLAWRAQAGNPIKRHGPGVGIAVKTAGYKTIIHLSPTQAEKLILALEKALTTVLVDHVMKT